MKPLIKLGVSGLNDSALESKALRITGAMTSNPDFPDSGDLVTAIDAAVTIFSDALAQAFSKDRVKIKLKNAAKKVLVKTITDLYGYLIYSPMANNPAAMAGTGYDFVLPKAKRTLMKPENFTVEVGQTPGSAILKFKKIKKSTGYFFLIAPAPVTNNMWMHFPVSIPYFEVTDLESMIPYSFQGGASFSGNRSVYTEIITKAVL